MVRINNPLDLPPPSFEWRQARWNGVTVLTYTLTWFDARRLASEALGVEEQVVGNMLEPYEFTEHTVDGAEPALLNRHPSKRRLARSADKRVRRMPKRRRS